MSELEIAREADAIENVSAPEAGHSLFGHQDIYQRLKKQSAINKLPGALLLHGPKGIGKATLAFSLAREVLETTSDQNRDQVREQIGGGVHPNVFVLRKIRKDSASFYTNIRVEDVRALIQKLRQTRGRAGHRICIIDAIDDCNNSSANALLKMLEEPPDETHFLLISHRPGLLLPTIRSRCQSHAMRCLPETPMAEILNGAGLNGEQIARITALAFGRPRRAFEALNMASNDILQDLSGWLQAPENSSDAHIIKLAEQLSSKKNVMEHSFGREMVLDWIAKEAKALFEGQPGIEPAFRLRLASANQLWDKANSLLLNADTYNLDKRQTLVSLFDAIKIHAEKTRSPANPE